MHAQLLVRVGDQVPALGIAQHTLDGDEVEPGAKPLKLCLSPDVVVLHARGDTSSCGAGALASGRSFPLARGSCQANAKAPLQLQRVLDAHRQIAAAPEAAGEQQQDCENAENGQRRAKARLREDGSPRRGERFLDGWRHSLVHAVQRRLPPRAAPLGGRFGQQSRYLVGRGRSLVRGKLVARPLQQDLRSRYVGLAVPRDLQRRPGVGRSLRQQVQLPELAVDLGALLPGGSGVAAFQRHQQSSFGAVEVAAAEPHATQGTPGRDVVLAQGDGSGVGIPGRFVLREPLEKSTPTHPQPPTQVHRKQAPRRRRVWLRAVSLDSLGSQLRIRQRRASGSGLRPRLLGGLLLRLFDDAFEPALEVPGVVVFEGRDGARLRPGDGLLLRCSHVGASEEEKSRDECRYGCSCRLDVAHGFVAPHRSEAGWD